MNRTTIAVLHAAAFFALAAVSIAQPPSLKYGDGQPDGEKEPRRIR